MNLIYKLKDIQTPRLIVRPVQLGDEIEINQALNHSLDVIQRWMPWAKDPSLETTKSFVELGFHGWSSGKSNDFPMVVIHKESNKIISASGYNDRSNLDVPMFEVGYWIDNDYSGQGYVTEYVTALSKFAISALDAARVQICTQHTNEKSIGVAKRCGFIQEAILKNYCIDCVTNKASDTVVFACFNLDILPQLDISWRFEG